MSNEPIGPTDPDDSEDDGIPPGESIVIGEGKGSYDLRRCQYYIKGKDESGKTILQISREPAFIIRLHNTPVSIDISYSLRVKVDMHLEEAIVVYQNQIIYSLAFRTGQVDFEKGDLLNIHFSIDVGNNKTVKVTKNQGTHGA